MSLTDWNQSYLDFLIKKRKREEKFGIEKQMTNLDLETRIDLVIAELEAISKILAELNFRLERLANGEA